MKQIVKLNVIYTFKLTKSDKLKIYTVNSTESENRCYNKCLQLELQMKKAVLSLIVHIILLIFKNHCEAINYSTMMTGNNIQFCLDGKAVSVRVY